MNVFVSLGQIGVFILLWILSFLLHEFCHSLEMRRQTGWWGIIHIDHRFPFGMWTTYHHNAGVILNDQLVDFAGGVYSSPVWFLFAVCACGVFSFFFVMLGWLQLVYGIMEGTGLKRYRYYWYGLIVTVTVVLWIWWFVL